MFEIPSKVGLFDLTWGSVTILAAFIRTRFIAIQRGIKETTRHISGCGFFIDYLIEWQF